MDENFCNAHDECAMANESGFKGTHPSFEYTASCTVATVTPFSLYRMCSTADLARALLRSSSAPARTASPRLSPKLTSRAGLLVSFSHQCLSGKDLPASSCFRKKSMTIAHSLCFHVMIAILQERKKSYFLKWLPTPCKKNAYSPPSWFQKLEGGR